MNEKLRGIEKIRGIREQVAEGLEEMLRGNATEFYVDDVSIVTEWDESKGLSYFEVVVSGVDDDVDEMAAFTMYDYIDLEDSFEILTSDCSYLFDEMVDDVTECVEKKLTN